MNIKSEIFIKNLTYFMKLKGYGKPDIANICDVGCSTVYDWFSGKSYPNNTNMNKLANGLGISEEKLTNTSTNRVAVLGRIPAGIPIEAIEEILDYEELSDKLVASGKEFFALKISGDSMFPEYLDGDVVIFEKASDCESGQKCAVMVNGNDATFKKVMKNDNGIILQPLNPKYDIIPFTNDEIINKPVRIIGIAREIRRTII